MPSFFKKLIYGKELSNPYLNRYHPGHTSTGAPLPSTSSFPTYQQPAEHVQSYTTSPDATSVTQPTNHTPSPLAIALDPRDYLAEARQLAGRDPVTGRPAPVQQFSTYAARSGQTISPTGRGNPQPAQRPLQNYPAASEPAFTPFPDAEPTARWSPKGWHTGELHANPYISGGAAAMGRRVPKTEKGRVNHAGIFVQDRDCEKKGKGKGKKEGETFEEVESETHTSNSAGPSGDIVLREESRKREEAARGYFAPERPPVREYYATA